MPFSCLESAVPPESDLHTQPQSLEIYGGTFNDVAGDQIFVNYTPHTTNEFETWMSAIDYAEVQNTTIRKRLGQTGKWCLNTPEFQSWYTLPNYQTLWLLGPPGVGKTVLSSVVVSYLQSRINATESSVACVYLSYKSKNQGSIEIIRSIVRQLWRSLPGARRTLESLKEAYNRFGSQPTLHQLCDAIRESIQLIPSIYIVIDALDEYIYHQRNPTASGTELLSTLASLGNNVKLLVTSRKITSIDEIMDCPGSVILDIPAASELDMQHYISQRAQRELPFELYEEILYQIISKVAETANGRQVQCFLIAEIHMNSLTQHLTLGELEDELNRLADNLDKAYEMIMERIQSQDEIRQELAYKILAWLSTSFRPLTLQELRHALAAGPGRSNIEKYLHTTDTILGVCAGLVQVDEKNDSVGFIHPTAHEFFQKHWSKLLPDLDTIVTRACLHYLAIPSLNSFEIIPNLQAYHESPTRADLVKEHHFFDYAARNWGHHARLCETALSDEIYAFLNDRYHGIIAFSYLMLSSLYELDSVQSDEGQLAGLMTTVFFDLSHSMERLVSGGANINAFTKQRRTPLLLAIETNQCSVIRSLIRKVKLNLNHCDANGRTALSLAASQDHQVTLKLLLSRRKKYTKGASTREHLRSINLSGSMSSVSSQTDEEDNKSRTPLSYASANGNRSFVGRLLRRCEVRVNHQDAEGRTPLSYAAECGHLRVVKRLLKDMRAIPDIQDKKGRTPLIYAIVNNHEAVARTIIKWKQVQMNVTDETGRTPLSYAAANASEALVSCLTGFNGIWLDTRDSIGRTPLTYAAIKGNSAAISALLKQSAIRRRINLPDHNGHTPLTHAAIEGHLEVVKILLEQKHIKPDFKDAVGKTALSYASQHGSREIVAMLLEGRCVDVNLEDREGRTPLSYAAENGHVGVVKLLIKQQSIKLNIKDKHGMTARQYAGQRNHQIVKRLLRRRHHSWNKDVVDAATFEWLKQPVKGGPSTLPR